MFEPESRYPGFHPGYNGSFGGRKNAPLRRPSAGVAQQVSRQDAEKAPMGQDVPSERACGAAPERGKSERSEDPYRGASGFGYFCPGRARRDWQK